MSALRRQSGLQRAPKRGAFTLVEMLVVIALSSFLLGIIVSLIISLQQWDQGAQVRSLRGEQLLRLTEALRTDIRRGTDVLLSVEGPLVVLSPDGEQARYELRGEGCVREVVRPGDAGPHSDLFAIGPAASWNVERKAGRHPLVAVTLEPVSTDKESVESRSVPLLVYAALGADVGPAPRVDAINAGGLRPE